MTYRIHFRPQALRQLLYLLEFLDYILGKHPFADVGYVGGNGLRRTREVVRFFLQLREVDATGRSGRLLRGSFRIERLRRRREMMPGGLRRSRGNEQSQQQRK